MTAEKHREVVKRLSKLSEAYTNVEQHSAGIEYTSLMICFLLQNKTALTVLLKLFDSFGEEWFPVTIGYQIARSIFEVDINAHYMSINPTENARRYIGFESVLNKKEMEAYKKHLNSDNDSWRDAMKFMWDNRWNSSELNITNKYNQVKSTYQRVNKNGRIENFNNWSGKSIRQMAIEVKHQEAYDIFYSELSSFTHIDVRLANRFLKLKPGQISWSARSNEFDYANVFRHSATFFTCFLELFSNQFSFSSKEDIMKCWEF
ncbi:MAG: DUF5677 domain-containing protein [Bacteroidota bacterium]